MLNGTENGESQTPPSSSSASRQSTPGNSRLGFSRPDPEPGVEARGLPAPLVQLNQYIDIIPQVGLGTHQQHGRLGIVSESLAAISL